MESKLVVFLCNAQRFEPLKMFCFIITVRIICGCFYKNDCSGDVAAVQSYIICDVSVCLSLSLQ